MPIEQTPEEKLRAETTAKGLGYKSVSDMKDVLGLSSANGEKIANNLTIDVNNRNQQLLKNLEANQQRAREKSLTPLPETLPPEVQAEVDAGKTPQQKATEELTKQRNEALTNVFSSFEGLALANTQQTQAMIGTLTSQYNERRKQLEQSNKVMQAVMTQSGIRSGAARYATEINQGILTDTEQQGIQRLQELDSKYSSAIAEANSALSQKNFTLAKEKNDYAIQIQDKFLTEMDKRAKEAMAVNKDINEKTLQAKRDSLVATLHSAGITSPTEIMATLNKSGYSLTFKEINDITKELEPKEEKSITGDYGTYLQLKSAGEIDSKIGFFDYLKEKKSAETILGRTGDYGEYLSLKESGEISNKETYLGYLRKKKQAETITEGFGEGVGTGNVQRDADSVMAGVLDPSKISTKNNYAASVMSEVSKRKTEAKKAGDIVGIIRASAGGKDTEASFNQTFEKAVNVIYQIADLQTTIENGKVIKNADGTETKIPSATGPILGIIRSLNPYDTKAQLIKAQLTAIVPNLARGIYGEVGVLTDNDVALYSKTLPNLKSTEELRNALVGIAIRSVQRSIENKIKINANRDLTHLEDVYLQVKKLADDMLAPLKRVEIKNNLENLNINSGEATSSPSDFWSKA